TLSQRQHSTRKKNAACSRSRKTSCSRSRKTSTMRVAEVVRLRRFTQSLPLAGVLDTQANLLGDDLGVAHAFEDERLLVVGENAHLADAEELFPGVAFDDDLADAGQDDDAVVRLAE